MNILSLTERASAQIVQGKFAEAEEMLMEARRIALAKDDKKALARILSVLVELHCSSEPRDFVRAEAFSREREQTTDSAYHRLQTAMLFYYAMQDRRRAISKLQDAISKGQQENDYATVYSSLSVLGQAFLDLDHTDEASLVLADLERLVVEKRRFVAGDETLFLERARSRQLDAERVKRIATALAPLCRDAEFKERLAALSK